MNRPLRLAECSQPISWVVCVYFVGERCIIATRQQCCCNPFRIHSRNVRNVFVICVLHIRRVKVWFLHCKSMVFGVQKGSFYFLASALLQCCDVLAAFYSVYFSVAITILVFPRCVRFVCLCCQKPVAFVLFVPFQFCLLFVPHGQ